jgi:hypothetical protein
MPNDSLDDIGGAPEKLLVLMEGESLFNDATSIVLFEIFFSMVKQRQRGHHPGSAGVLQQAVEIFGKIVWLTFGEHCTHMHSRRMPSRRSSSPVEDVRSPSPYKAAVSGTEPL